jgi:hypothetical protein
MFLLYGAMPRMISGSARNRLTPARPPVIWHPMRKDKAPDSILRLIDNFDRNVAAYRSPAYNEAQVRKEFLDPFFEAMGWDMANRQGFDLRYRQVVHEAALRVGGTTKAPDYSFRARDHARTPRC